jgi:ABC-type phosphate transport system permease subunit
VSFAGGVNPSLAAVPRRFRRGAAAHGNLQGHALVEERLWKGACRVAVLLPLAALVFALSVLAVKAVPAIRVNGWNFLTGRTWTVGSGYGAVVHTDGVAHLQGASFGALTIIVGTLESSAIAIVVALPISIGAAFALTERLPKWVSQPLGFAVELLAGIPSVVIGLWGLLISAPSWLVTCIRSWATTCPTCRCWTGSAGRPDSARACSPPDWCSAS